MTHDELRKIVDDATPGPWEKTKYYIDMSVHTDCGIVSNEGYSICRAPRYETEEQYNKDFDFIAAARTAIPALLDEVARYRKALEFYADEKNHTIFIDKDSGLAWTHVEIDDGQRALDALQLEGEM